MFFVMVPTLIFSWTETVWIWSFSNVKETIIIIDRINVFRIKAIKTAMFSKIWKTLFNTILILYDEKWEQSFQKVRLYLTGMYTDWLFSYNSGRFHSAVRSLTRCRCQCHSVVPQVVYSDMVDQLFSAATKCIMECLRFEKSLIFWDFLTRWHERNEALTMHVLLQSKIMKYLRNDLLKLPSGQEQSDEFRDF